MQLRKRAGRGVFRRGVAAVELACLLPFLALLFVIALDFGRVFYTSLTVTNCARNGALYGSRDAAAAANQAGIATAAKADATNLDPTKIGVTSSTTGAGDAQYVDVTVTYPFQTITGIVAGNQITLSRSVRMLVVPATPNFN